MNQKTLIFILLGFILTSQAGISQSLKVGDIAPGFSLKNVDDKEVSLSMFEQQKGVILIFTCNHCPYSIAYEDRINDLDRIYKPQGWPVVAINPNDPAVQPADSFEKMQERAAEKSFSFPYLFDDGQKIFPQYGATRTPHVFLLQLADDGFRVRYIGAIDDNHSDAASVKEKFLENAIVALQAGKSPEPDFTKAIGCTIKVKK
jgi:peroxiredoxin